MHRANFLYVVNRETKRLGDEMAGSGIGPQPADFFLLLLFKSIFLAIYLDALRRSVWGPIWETIGPVKENRS